MHRSLTGGVTPVALQLSRRNIPLHDKHATPAHAWYASCSRRFPSTMTLAPCPCVLRPY